MIVVTASGITGKRIVRTLGLARGNTIRARHIGRDIMAGLRNIVGGEVSEYTKLLAESREQALDRIPEGRISVDDKKIALPDKREVLTNMEQLIHQFMVVTEGPELGPAERYFGVENPKGELGFYVVADGTGRPKRMRIRGPSFLNIASFPYALKGAMLADVVSILGSFDFVMGECDR